MRDGGKRLRKIQHDDIQLIPHITALHHVMHSKQKLGLCGVLFPKPMVFRAQDLIIGQVTPGVSAEDVLQHYTCNRSQGNRAIVGWIWKRFVKTGAIEAFFHWVGISPVCTDWLMIAVKAEAISVTRECRILAGISSRPDAYRGLREAKNLCTPHDWMNSEGVSG